MSQAIPYLQRRPVDLTASSFFVPFSATPNNTAGSFLFQRPPDRAVSPSPTSNSDPVAVVGVSPVLKPTGAGATTADTHLQLKVPPSSGVLAHPLAEFLTEVRSSDVTTPRTTQPSASFWNLGNPSALPHAGKLHTQVLSPRLKGTPSAALVSIACLHNRPAL